MASKHHCCYNIHTKITNTVILDSVVFATLSILIGLPLVSSIIHFLLSFIFNTFYSLLQSRTNTIICSSTNFFRVSNSADLITSWNTRFSDEKQWIISRSNCSGRVGDAITLGFLCNVPRSPKIVLAKNCQKSSTFCR